MDTGRTQIFSKCVTFTNRFAQTVIGLFPKQFLFLIIRTRLQLILPTKPFSFPNCYEWNMSPKCLPFEKKKSKSKICHATSSSLPFSPTSLHWLISKSLAFYLMPVSPWGPHCQIQLPVCIGQRLLSPPCSISSLRHFKETQLYYLACQHTLVSIWCHNKN